MIGGLAIALAQSLDASMIVSIAVQADDPNFGMDETAPYKAKLAGMLDGCRLLVDIHGMKDAWGSDICIGTGNAVLTPGARKLVDALKLTTSRAGLAMTTNHPFASLSRGTVSEFARRHGCEALQLEISLRCRTENSIGKTFSIIRNGLLEWLEVCRAA